MWIFTVRTLNHPDKPLCPVTLERVPAVALGFSAPQFPLLSLSLLIMTFSVRGASWHYWLPFLSPCSLLSLLFPCYCICDPFPLISSQFQGALLVQTHFLLTEVTNLRVGLDTHQSNMGQRSSLLIVPRVAADIATSATHFTFGGLLLRLQQLQMLQTHF